MDAPATPSTPFPPATPSTSAHHDRHALLHRIRLYARAHDVPGALRELNAIFSTQSSVVYRRQLFPDALTVNALTVFMEEVSHSGSISSLALLQLVLDEELLLKSRTHTLLQTPTIRRPLGYGELVRPLYRALFQSPLRELAGAVTSDAHAEILMIIANARESYTAAAQGIYETLVARSLRVSESSARVLMHHLIKKGDVNGAKTVYFTIESPALETKKMVARAYARDGDTRALESLDGVGSGSGGVSHTTTLIAHAQRGHLDTVLSVYAGIRHPSAKDREAVLLCYVQRDDLEGALGWVRKVEGERGAGRGAGASAGLSRRSIYTRLLTLFVRRLDVDGAMEVVDMMRAEHLPVRLDHYAQLIALHARRCDDAAALHTLHTMHLSPSLECWSGVMNAHANACNWHSVIGVYKRIRARFRLTAPTCNTLIKAYVMLGSAFENVLAVVRDMLAMGVRGDETTFALVMQSACDMGRIDAATALHEEHCKWSEEGLVHPPNAIHYTILIAALLRVGQFADARKWYGRMKEKFVQPDSVTYGVILASYLARGGEENVQVAKVTLANLLGQEENESRSNLNSSRTGNGNGNGNSNSTPTRASWMEASRSHSRTLSNVLRPFLQNYGKKFTPELARETFEYMADIADGAGDITNLTMLMDGYRRVGNYAVVDDIWGSILGSAGEREGHSKHSTQSTQSQPPRNTLCLPLSIYMDSLTMQHRLTDLHDTFRVVRERGFALDAHNWNHLAVALAKLGDIRLAFAVLERIVRVYVTKRRKGVYSWYDTEEKEEKEKNESNKEKENQVDDTPQPNRAAIRRTNTTGMRQDREKRNGDIVPLLPSPTPRNEHNVHNAQIDLLKYMDDIEAEGGNQMNWHAHHRTLEVLVQVRQNMSPAEWMDVQAEYVGDVRGGEVDPIRPTSRNADMSNNSNSHSTSPIEREGSVENETMTASAHGAHGAHSSAQPSPPIPQTAPLNVSKEQSPAVSNIVRKKLGGFVGFANLPNQVHRKSVRKGFSFTCMVVGESGLGKSTLVNTLFETSLYQPKSLPELGSELSSTVGIENISADIEENGVRLKLTVVDTPGFGDFINNDSSWDPIVTSIESRFDQYLEQENRVNRAKLNDNRVNACIYFIQPTGHSLRQVDIEFMRRLHTKVNLIPVIAKSDTLSEEEVDSFKRRILADIEYHKIEIFKAPAYEMEDDETIQENSEIESKIPFAIVGSTQTIQTGDGRSVRGRSYPWGVVEVDNEEHCDFTKLRQMMIRTHMEELKENTGILYENYRSEKMLAMGVQQDATVFKEVNPTAKAVEEKTLHDAKLSKMEAEMKLVFQQKVQEKEAKLRQSEEELYARHREMKESLEKQRGELDDKRRRLESGRPLTPERGGGGAQSTQKKSRGLKTEYMDMEYLMLVLVEVDIFAAAINNAKTISVIVDYNELFIKLYLKLINSNHLIVESFEHKYQPILILYDGLFEHSYSSHQLAQINLTNSVKVSLELLNNCLIYNKLDVVEFTDSYKACLDFHNTYKDSLNTLQLTASSSRLQRDQSIAFSIDCYKIAGILDDYRDTYTPDELILHHTRALIEEIQNSLNEYHHLSLHIKQDEELHLVTQQSIHDTRFDRSKHPPTPTHSLHSLHSHSQSHHQHSSQQSFSFERIPYSTSIPSDLGGSSMSTHIPIAFELANKGKLGLMANMVNRSNDYDIITPLPTHKSIQKRRQLDDYHPGNSYNDQNQDNEHDYDYDYEHDHEHDQSTSPSEYYQPSQQLEVDHDIQQYHDQEHHHDMFQDCSPYAGIVECTTPTRPTK
ncbi:hypothetical protein E3P78_02979 [Wallemia ichthyophaga]|nr:hypothetical protein E3P78_02979 [Wallemia ichthyophaga]